MGFVFPRRCRRRDKRLLCQVWAKFVRLAGWPGGAHYHRRGEFCQKPARALVFLVTTVLATFFFSKDWAKIRALIQRVLPKSGNRALRFMKNEMIHALISYFKAQFKLMGITFMELLAGFILLRQPYAIFLGGAHFGDRHAAGAGHGHGAHSLGGYQPFDEGLPPGHWPCGNLFGLHAGAPAFGAEILGRQIGIHPLVTLICIYAGLRL